MLKLTIQIALLVLGVAVLRWISAAQGGPLPPVGQTEHPVLDDRGVLADPAPADRVPDDQAPDDRAAVEPDRPGSSGSETPDADDTAKDPVEPPPAAQAVPKTPVVRKEVLLAAAIRYTADGWVTAAEAIPRWVVPQAPVTARTWLGEIRVTLDIDPERADDESWLLTLPPLVADPQQELLDRESGAFVRRERAVLAVLHPTEPHHLRVLLPELPEGVRIHSFEATHIPVQKVRKRLRQWREDPARPGLDPRPREIVEEAATDLSVGCQWENPATLGAGDRR